MDRSCSDESKKKESNNCLINFLSGQYKHKKIKEVFLMSLKSLYFKKISVVFRGFWTIMRKHFSLTLSLHSDVNFQSDSFFLIS